MAQFRIVAAKTARLVLRSDLWRDKQACDSELKTCLLNMLEWHARAIYGPGRDIWYEGRFLAQWADERVMAALPGTFALYNKSDINRALLQTITLYRWLADETAAQLDFDPLPYEDDIAAWISAL